MNQNERVRKLLSYLEAEERRLSAKLEADRSSAKLAEESRRERQRFEQETEERSAAEARQKFEKIGLFRLFDELVAIKPEYRWNFHFASEHEGRKPGYVTDLIVGKYEDDSSGFCSSWTEGVEVRFDGPMLQVNGKILLLDRIEDAIGKALLHPIKLSQYIVDHRKDDAWY